MFEDFLDVLEPKLHKPLLSSTGKICHRIYLGVLASSFIHTFQFLAGPPTPRVLGKFFAIDKFQFLDGNRFFCLGGSQDRPGHVSFLPPAPGEAECDCKKRLKVDAGVFARKFLNVFLKVLLSFHETDVVLSVCATVAFLSTDQCLRDMQWLQAEREEERRTANAAAMAMYNAREADFLPRLPPAFDTAPLKHLSGSVF